MLFLFFTKIFIANASTSNCQYFNLSCNQTHAVLSLNQTCYSALEPAFSTNLTNLHVSPTENITNAVISNECQLSNTLEISYEKCFNQSTAFILHFTEIDGLNMFLSPSQELFCNNTDTDYQMLEMSKESLIERFDSDKFF